MIKLTFVEGVDAVGKTTLVRNLLRFSNYTLSGIQDRGPVSKIVWGLWARQGGWSDWIPWFEEFADAVRIVLVVDQPTRIFDRLSREMRDTGYAGYPWTLDLIQSQQWCYENVVASLSNRCKVEVITAHYDAIPMHAVNPDPLTDMTRYLARKLGFAGDVTRNAITTPPNGDRQ